MITLTVISFNGMPGDSSLTAQFDELGGTIGRADTNQLVLPDPDRAISRVHAQIVFRGGAFAVVDRGSNPILVNGQPVGSGREQRVKPGDSVQIGGYVLGVSQSAGSGAAAAPADPFADLLGPAAASRAPAAAGPALFDPLSSPQTSPGVYNKRPAPPPPMAPAPQASGIPDDWDPFAPDPEHSTFAPPVAQQRAVADLIARAPANRNKPGNLGLDSGAGAAGPLIPGLGGGSAPESSLDNLFGLGPSSGGDPLANSLLDAPMAKPNMAANADPMASLNSAPRAVGQAAQDNLSLLNQPFQAPPPARPAAPALPAGAVLSWGNSDTSSTIVVPPTGSGRMMPPVDALAPQPVAAPYAPPNIPPAAPVPRPQPPVQASPVTGTPGDVDNATLLAALREGLDVPTLQINRLTPELMRLIGQLLHEAAAGTIDLLVARSALKREVKAEATMILSKQNNPLKFSPTAETALQHLLSPPSRGFMAAAPALRDAYNDLRAHQFGVVAGMRAALEGVLDRFDPAELEGRLTQRSGLMSLLPGSRKARMWEIFTEHYEQISTEAEENFHSLFGKAFLEAYEEHIDQLKKGKSS